jgi:hypothetical protein
MSTIITALALLAALLLTSAGGATNSSPNNASKGINPVQHSE